MFITTRNYEALYIVDATLTDEQVEPIIAKYSKLITDQGGEVQAAGRWDKRRLAYEVAGRREGIYILMYFTGEPSVADELDRVLRISNDSFRHLITRVEPQHVDITRIEQAQASAESTEQEAAQAEEAPIEEAPVAEAPEAPETQDEEQVEAAPAEEPTGEETAEPPTQEETPAEEQPAVAESTEETHEEEPTAG